MRLRIHRNQPAIRICGTLLGIGFVLLGIYAILGAGFGGSVWALVEQSASDSFVSAWRRAYLREFPAREADARFLTTQPSAGARWL